MKKTIKSEGVDYELSTKLEDNQKAIKVNINIKARDWKKAKNLDVVLVENDFPFRVTSYLFFGNEEYYVYEDKSEMDYREIKLYIDVSSLEEKIFYSTKIKNPFYENLTIFFNPFN